MHTEPMTQTKWSFMTPAQKEAARDYSGLTPQLKGLEGYRVEVETTYGETRRFIVGRSTGWKPCHLEIMRRNSMGGGATEAEYKTVRALYKARG
jgi:hypothetical protein